MLQKTRIPNIISMVFYDFLKNLKILDNYAEPEVTTKSSAKRPRWPLFNHSPYYMEFILAMLLCCLFLLPFWFSFLYRV